MDSRRDDGWQREDRESACVEARESTVLMRRSYPEKSATAVVACILAGVGVFIVSSALSCWAAPLLGVVAILGVRRNEEQFELDRPFLIYMQKQDAEHPFFVMWADNAELLTRQ
jgi:hypothetical protein